MFDSDFTSRILIATLIVGGIAVLAVGIGVGALIMWALG